MFGSTNNNPEIENVAAEIMRHRIADIEALCDKTIALGRALDAEESRAKASVDAMAALSVSEQTTAEPKPLAPAAEKANLSREDVDRLSAEAWRLAS